MFYLCVVSMVAISHMGLFGTWSVAGMIEKLSVYLILS